MIYTLATRGSEGISIIHDRNPMFVRLSDGALRNGYTIRIVNKDLKHRDFIVSVDGLPSSLIDFVGLPPRADGRQLVDVGPDQTKEVRVVVTDYSKTPPAPSTTHPVQADRRRHRRGRRDARPLLRTARVTAMTQPQENRAS